MGVVQSSVEEKFLSRFDLPADPDGCWEWNGYKQEHGYGVIRVKNRNESGNFRAHVLAMKAAGIRAPDGDYVVHHVCGNRGCVNPDHLEWILRDAHTRLHLGDTCPQGHEKSPENIYFYRGRPYGCRICRNMKGSE